MLLLEGLLISILMAGGLLMVLYLFISVKRELWLANRLWTRKLDDAVGTAKTMAAEVEELKFRLREAEERAGVLVAPEAPRSGLNLGKRTQALRLFRRGDTPSQIAAVLGLPLAEVELLLKVHQMARNLPEPAPEPAAPPSGPSDRSTLERDIADIRALVAMTAAANAGPQPEPAAPPAPPKPAKPVPFSLEERPNPEKWLREMGIESWGE